MIRSILIELICQQQNEKEDRRSWPASAGQFPLNEKQLLKRMIHWPTEWLTGVKCRVSYQHSLKAKEEEGDWRQSQVSGRRRLSDCCIRQAWSGHSLSSGLSIYLFGDTHTLGLPISQRYSYSSVDPRGLLHPPDLILLPFPINLVVPVQFYHGMKTNICRLQRNETQPWVRWDFANKDLGEGAK